MKIRITDAKCGLKKSEVYDLCEMAANTLIAAGQAVKHIESKPNADTKVLSKTVSSRKNKIS